MAHTARFETLDIFSQAARMGCNLQLLRPSAFSDGAFDCAPDEMIDLTSESETEDEVRLMDGIDEREDFMDRGELGESVAGDCGVGLSSSCHKRSERDFRRIRPMNGHTRKRPGSNASNEALAEVVGEKEPGALYDSVVDVGGILEMSIVSLGGCEDMDKVRYRPREERKMVHFSSSSAGPG